MILPVISLRVVSDTSSRTGLGRPAGRLRTRRARPPRGSSRSSAHARSRRSRSAGCWSGGRAERRRPRRPGRGRRPCAGRPSARRRRCPVSNGPLGRYLLELEADQAEGRSWYGEPGRAELVEWQPVLSRAGVHASPVRVAQAYLELAVLVRALEGLATAARMRSAPNPSDLWAGLFDLRENLLERRARRPESPGRLSHVRCLAPDMSVSDAWRASPQRVESLPMARRRTKRVLKPRAPSRVRKTKRAKTKKPRAGTSIPS